MLCRASNDLALDDFVDQHDLLLNGPSTSLAASHLARHPQTEFRRIMNLATMTVCNNVPSIEGLYAHLDELDLLNEERLRPGWDTYFMVDLPSAAKGPLCLEADGGSRPWLP